MGSSGLGFGDWGAGHLYKQSLMGILLAGGTNPIEELLVYGPRCRDVQGLGGLGLELRVLGPKVPGWFRYYPPSKPLPRFPPEITFTTLDDPK